MATTAKGRRARRALSALDWVSHLAFVGTFAALGVYAGVVAWMGQAAAPRLWVCPWRALTGTPCPTCGIVRSAAAALRGQWRASLAYHPLAALIVATLAYLAFRCARGLWRGQPVAVGRVGGWCLLAIGVACWVAKLLSPAASW